MRVCTGSKDGNVSLPASSPFRLPAQCGAMLGRFRMSQRRCRTAAGWRQARIAVAWSVAVALSLVLWEFGPQLLALARGGERVAVVMCNLDTKVEVWIRYYHHPVYRRLMTVIVRRGWRRWATPEEPVFERESLRLCESYVCAPEQGHQTHELTVMADTLPLCRIDFLTGEIHGHMYDGYTIRATALRAPAVGGRALRTACDSPLHGVLAEAVVR